MPLSVVGALTVYALAIRAPPDTAIRPFVASSDALPVSRLIDDAFLPAEGYNPLQRAAIIAETFFSLNERASNSSNLMLVCCGVEDSSKIMGFVECFLGGAGKNTLPKRLRGLDHPHISSLAVDASMRRRGIAESLVRAIEEDVVRGFEKDAAEQQRKKKISLEVEEDNDAALGLYTDKLGYEVTHRDADGRKLVGDVFFGRSERCVKLTLEKQF